MSSRKEFIAYYYQEKVRDFIQSYYPLSENNISEWAPEARKLRGIYSLFIERTKVGDPRRIDSSIVKVATLRLNKYFRQAAVKDVQGVIEVTTEVIDSMSMSTKKLQVNMSKLGDSIAQYQSSEVYLLQDMYEYCRDKYYTYISSLPQGHTID